MRDCGISMRLKGVFARIFHIGKYVTRLLVVVALALVFFILQHNGLVWFNMPSDKSYPIKGVDVSAHQGEIDWQILKSQNISFAFIKATEGSTWVDKRFAYNFAESRKQGLYVGAYHFFSFDSSGLTQAQNFINNVPNIRDSKALPPVVDIEFYGSKAKNPPPPQKVYAELDRLLMTLEKHYKIKPIIYTTPSFYDMYLRERYAKEYMENPLWIRSVFFAPDSVWARLFNVYFQSWSFWQYDPQGVLNGYSGGEKRIDLNAFNGDEKQLQLWLKKQRIH